MINKPLLYLAGPITGLSWEQATKWRSYVESYVDGYFTCNSPLRNKRYLSQEKILQDNYSEHLPSSQRGIFARDTFDVIRSDALFVNFLQASKVSIGTVMEISLAWYLRKPVIIVMELDNIHQHSMLRESTPWIVQTLDDGIDLLREVFI